MDATDAPDWSKLTPTWDRYFRLQVGEALTPGAVAMECGVSRQAVYNALERARERLGFASVADLRRAAAQDPKF